MLFTVQSVSGTCVALCASDGLLLSSGRDATDLIGETRSAGASIVAVPFEWLDPMFFQLRTGVAGGFVQKFVNYGVRLVILGDTNDLASQSS